MKLCYKCGTEWKSGMPSRKDVCTGCRSDLRVCLNCVFYQETAANKCREVGIELVADKDKANFCDHFKFGDRQAQFFPGNSPPPPTRSEWDKLFKK